MLDFLKDVRTAKWLIPILAIVLYANTLTHDYTQDDAIVIYENEFTTQGIQGIPSLLKYDTFRGFFKEEGKAKMVSGGRYRPLTPVMFAVEYQLFGKQPFIGHLLNVLFYALLGFLIFHTLALLLKGVYDAEAAQWLAFGAALLFIAHPIHTEAVANIKGRDEIMAMLGSVGALWYGLRYVDTKQVKHLLYTFLLFFLGILSKENTITYLSVFPLAIFLFRREQITIALKPWLVMLGAAIVFIGIRTAVLGFDFGGTPMELMNNPFLRWTGSEYVEMAASEKFATICYTLGLYIGLLLFPHPLTHDYYPRHIEVMSFGDWQVILSVLMYIAMVVGAIVLVKKRKTVAFGLLYFLLTLSIVSNIVFPIGTNMSERFLFLPSLGFTLLVSLLLFSVVRKRFSPSVTMGILVVLLGLYSVKTVSRNTVWQNDFTLFTTDVKTSPNSAKVQNAAGGTKTDRAATMPKSPKRTALLREAIVHLDKAMEIHPTYRSPLLIKGNAHFYLEEYDASVKAYQAALAKQPNDESCRKNLAIALREGGKYAGEKQGNLDKALALLQQSNSINPNDTETIRLMGVAYGVKGEHQKAVDYFLQVAEKAPTKEIYENLSLAYTNLGKLEKAAEYRLKASQF